MRNRARGGRGYGGAGLGAYSGQFECPRCGEEIRSWNDACKVKGRWIHKACHGGADDE